MAELAPDLDLAPANRSAFAPGQPEADALFHLLAHMAFSDGSIHPEELAFLGHLLPGRDPGDLRAWALHVGSTAPKLDDVARIVTDAESRWTMLRFAARMAWKDGVLEDGERQFLQTLASALDLPASGVDRVLAEMAPSAKKFDPERILEVVKAVQWRAVQLAAGPLVSPDLLAANPPGSEPICRVGVDRVEVLALCTQGFVGRFQEGAGFVSWGSVVSTEPGSGLGASLRIHCEDGVSWTLVDTRLAGLTLILDRLLRGGQARPVAEPLTFERHGGDLE